MALIQLPGLDKESLAQVEAKEAAEKARVAGLLDRAMDLAPKPWPIPRPEDQAEARQELASLADYYWYESLDRDGGSLAEAKCEIERLATAAEALNDALHALGQGARRVLSMPGKAHLKAWELAAGGALPPVDEGDSFSLGEDPETGTPETMSVGPGKWSDRTEALAKWTRDLAGRMRMKAPKVGRRDLDTLLRGESIRDWLLRQLASWMEKHEWDLEGTRTQLVPLARLIHEAAMNEPAAAGAFRAAHAKATARAKKAGKRRNSVN